MAPLACSGWLTHCEQFAEAQSIEPEYIRILFAFGGAQAPSLHHTKYESLEQWALQALSDLPTQIIDTLDGEIDKPQAVMFARRFSSVVDLLNKQSAHHGESRLLRVGIIVRMLEVLRAPGPRALRVRAVADYFYSHCALIHHRPQADSPPPDTFDSLIHSREWKNVAPGIAWKKVEGLTDHGPIHVNILRTTGAQLRAMDCREIDKDISLEALAIKESAPAAVSGGFFLYSEADIDPPSRRTDPVSLLVDNGRIVAPPALHRASIVQTSSGRTYFETIGPLGCQVRWGTELPITISKHNQPAQGGLIQSYNRAWGSTAPEPEGWAMAIVGHTIVSVSQGALSIPLAGLVITVPEGPMPLANTAVDWTLPQVETGSSVTNAMAGGPMLVTDGRVDISRESEDFMLTAPPVTFSQDETFDQNLLPRMAAGVDSAGDIFFAAIDGRNFYKAPGMTLEQTSQWMRALGCTRAMNLDGGSSKRMVVNGRVVDHPSTEVVGAKSDKKLVRPVHSAVLIFPPPHSAKG